jgi:malate synthase
MQCKSTSRRIIAEDMLTLDDLLTPPLATETNWTEEEKTKNLKITVKGSWVMLYVGLTWV